MSKVLKALPRFSYEELGISPKLCEKLSKQCEQGLYSRETLLAACEGFEFCFEWILLSVTKHRSFDKLCAFEETICPVSRTDFYGCRRMFFHNLDCIVRKNGNKRGVMQKKRRNSKG